MAAEQLWSDEVIDRIAKLCGDRSIAYGYALGQRSDLVDLLRAAATERLNVTASPTQIYAALRSDRDMDTLDINKAQAFWNDLNWGLTVEELIGELQERIIEFGDPFRRIPKEIQSTEEVLGINDAIDPHAPVDIY